MIQVNNEFLWPGVGIFTPLTVYCLRGHDHLHQGQQDGDFNVCKAPCSVLVYSSSLMLPGVLTGLIYGMILQIYQLCSKETDVDREMYLFTRRVLDRGHSLDDITTLFSKAINNVKKNLQLSPARRK